MKRVLSFLLMFAVLLTLVIPLNVFAEEIETPSLPDTSVEKIYYQDYKITVTDSSGALIDKAIAFYDSNRDQIQLYLPESTNASIDIIGLQDGEEVTGPLSFTIDNSSLPNHKFDQETQTLNLGSTQHGYMDTLYGQLENGPGLALKVFKGKMGTIHLNDIDGEPYNGEVYYSISYQMMDGYGEASASNDYAFEGRIYFPMQDDFLGLNFAYIVVSPFVRTGQKVQANTPWFEITDKINDNTSIYYDLGTTQFQKPQFTGYLYESDQSTPLNNVEVYLTNRTFIQDDILLDVFMSPGVVEQDGNTNIFYLASLGELFNSEYYLETSTFGDNMMSIQSTIDLATQTSGNYFIPEDQITISMKDPDGNLLEEINGYGKQINMSVNGSNTTNIYSGYYSTVSFGGLKNGDEVELQLKLNLGDYDALQLSDSLRISFVYNEDHSKIEMRDSAGQPVEFTTDEEGLLCFDLYARPSQFIGRVYQGDVPVTDGVSAKLIDADSNEVVAEGYVHSNLTLGDGILNLGAETNLSGDYILRLSDPKNTVEYYGADFEVQLPQNMDEILRFDMPASTVYGQLKLDAQDESASENLIDRVYVNIFNAAGKFIKNVSVRNDGMFTMGSMEEGKYFAKAFISPISSLVDRYCSSKMSIFEIIDSNQQMTIEVPLAPIGGKGYVIKPDETGFDSDVWVRIYNAQGVEIEALKANWFGEFQIPVLPEGNYKIKAFAADGYMDSITSDLFMNDDGTYFALLELTEPQLTGNISDENDNFLPGVQILLFDSQMNLVSSTETDPNGNYAFGGLVSGNYYLQAQPTTSGTYVTTERMPLTYLGGVVAQNLTLESVQLTGSVNNPDGSTAISGWVHVYADGNYDRSVRIDADGKFYLGALDAGVDYQVFAQDDLGQFGSSIQTAIETDQPVTLQFRDKEIDEYGILKFNSEILSNTKYILYNAEGQALYQSMTNVFGEVTLSDLASGEYTLVVPMDNDFYYVKLQLRNDGQAVGDLVLIRGEE